MIKVPRVCPGGSTPQFVEEAPRQGTRFSFQGHNGRHYGDHRIILLVRDPWWLFAYWETSEEGSRKTLTEIQNQHQTPERLTLRVHQLSDAQSSFFDIEINPEADNWYIEGGVPDRDWFVELGIRTREHGFFPLARSNRVHTPRFGVSDVVDEEWMMPDELYWKIFGLSGGFADVGSSLELRQRIEARLKGAVTSPGLRQ